MRLAIEQKFLNRQRNIHLEYTSIENNLNEEVAYEMLKNKKEWDNLEKLTSEQINQLLKPLMDIAFVYPIRFVSHATADIIQNTLHLLPGKLKDKLQFDALGKMATKFIQTMDNPRDIYEIMPYIIIKFSYYFWEKISDDLAQLDPNNPTKFLNQETMLLFNEICTLQAYDNSPIKLHSELERLKRYGKIENVEIDITSNIPFVNQKLLNQIFKIFMGISGNILKLTNDPHREEVMSFFKNPLISFLQVNVAIVNQVIRSLSKLEDMYPELKMTISHATESVIQRYLTSMYSTHKHAQGDQNTVNNEEETDGIMEIEDALIISEFTILTRYTYDVWDALNNRTKSQELNILGGRLSSILIRLLNDAGPTLEDVEGTIQLLELLRENSPELAPREFFKTFYRYIDKSGILKRKKKDLVEEELALLNIADYLSRFIKDSIENKGRGELNTFLSSGLRGDETVQEQWEIFFHVLRIGAVRYIETKQELSDNLEKVDTEELYPNAAKNKGEFTFLNYVFYKVLFGDYDEKVEEAETAEIGIDQNGKTILPYQEYLKTKKSITHYIPGFENIIRAKEYAGVHEQ